MTPGGRRRGWRPRSIPGAYHLAAADQDRTTERHDRLAAHGILTLHFPPKRIKTDAPGIVSELQSAIDKGLARPRLPITAVPQAA